MYNIISTEEKRSEYDFYQRKYNSSSLENTQKESCLSFILQRDSEIRLQYCGLHICAF